MRQREIITRTQDAYTEATQNASEDRESALSELGKQFSMLKKGTVGGAEHTQPLIDKEYLTNYNNTDPSAASREGRSDRQ